MKINRWIPSCLVDVTDESNEKVLSCQWSIFVVGAGGFGGKRSSDLIVPTAETPNRPADASVQYKTSIDQVITQLIYFFFKFF